MRMPSLLPVIVSAAVLLCAAVVASVWPAARAARIDVMEEVLHGIRRVFRIQPDDDRPDVRLNRDVDRCRRRECAGNQRERECGGREPEFQESHANEGVARQS